MREDFRLGGETSCTVEQGQHRFLLLVSICIKTIFQQMAVKQLEEGAAFF